MDIERFIRDNYLTEGHVCFYVSKCKLFEEIQYKEHFFIAQGSYFISEILWPDTDKLSDEEMITISKILNGEET